MIVHVVQAECGDARNYSKYVIAVYLDKDQTKGREMMARKQAEAAARHESVIYTMTRVQTGVWAIFDGDDKWAGFNPLMAGAVQRAMRKQ